jgi:hypothetical protein
MNMMCIAFRWIHDVVYLRVYMMGGVSFGCYIRERGVRAF